MLYVYANNIGTTPRERKTQSMGGKHSICCRTPILFGYFILQYRRVPKNVGSSIAAVFSIPADLGSYLRSKRLTSMQYKAQGLRTYHMRLSKPFLSLNSYRGMFLKIWKFQPGRSSATRSLAPGTTIVHRLLPSLTIMHCS